MSTVLCSAWLTMDWRFGGPQVQGLEARKERSQEDSRVAAFRSATDASGNKISSQIVRCAGGADSDIDRLRRR